MGLMTRLAEEAKNLPDPTPPKASNYHADLRAARDRMKPKAETDPSAVMSYGSKRNTFCRVACPKCGRPAGERNCKGLTGMYLHKERIEAFWTRWGIPEDQRDKMPYLEFPDADDAPMWGVFPRNSGGTYSRTPVKLAKSFRRAEWDRKRQEEATKNKKRSKAWGNYYKSLPCRLKTQDHTKPAWDPTNPKNYEPVHPY